MNRKIGVIALLMIAGVGLCQPLLAQRIDMQGWDILSDVSFSPKYLEEYRETYLVPDFGEAPRKYEGKNLQITGYIIPADPDQDIYILSMYPFASCFFCGNAGPETIVELIFRNEDKKRKKTYKIDDIRAFKGVLRLNKHDVTHTNYILDKAEEIR